MSMQHTWAQARQLIAPPSLRALLVPQPDFPTVCVHIQASDARSSPKGACLAKQGELKWDRRIKFIQCIKMQNGTDALYCSPHHARGGHRSAPRGLPLRPRSPQSNAEETGPPSHTTIIDPPTSAAFEMVASPLRDRTEW